MWSSLKTEAGPVGSGARARSLSCAGTRQALGNSAERRAKEPVKAYLYPCACACAFIWRCVGAASTSEAGATCGKPVNAAAREGPFTEILGKAGARTWAEGQGKRRKFSSGLCNLAAYPRRALGPVHYRSSSCVRNFQRRWREDDEPPYRAPARERIRWENNFLGYVSGGSSGCYGSELYFGFFYGGKSNS